MKGLYIHIPFCTRKCFYCDFVSTAYNETLADKYLSALEIESRKYKNEVLYTVYIGGGTPSALSLSQLKKLISIIKNNFDISKLCEFTVELNPESVTKEKLEFLFSAVVTSGNINSSVSARLSFGLQSVYDDKLKILGRLHDYEKFKNIYFLARKVGFDNINVDLMFGIPEQNIENWQKTLTEVLFLKPQHISLYPLTIEPKTAFYKNNIPVDTDLQAQMYDIACSILQKNGFEHYEISNWEKDKKYSRHNKLYWQNKEYIGLGAAAASYYKRYRYKNDTNILRYIENTLNGKDTVIEKEYINDELYNKEKIMLGLRLSDGVDIKYFENKKDILEKYLNENLLKLKDNKVSLTQKSLFISNSILSDFI